MLIPAAVRDQDGFTLVEVLVVTLLIGILASLALPMFLGQRERGQDAGAMSHTRSALTHAEACFQVEQDYRSCDEAEDFDGAGLALVAGAPAAGSDEVQFSGTGEETYLITGSSRGGNLFTIEKTASGTLIHDCDTGGEGGCPTADAGGISDWASAD